MLHLLAQENYSPPKSKNAEDPYGPSIWILFILMFSSLTLEGILSFAWLLEQDVVQYLFPHFHAYCNLKSGHFVPFILFSSKLSHNVS
jgi:hypothetical protein